MNKFYLNKFELISYNLHNGNIDCKNLKNTNYNKQEDSQVTSTATTSKKYKFTVNNIPKEYWVIKNKNNEFKILVKSQDIEISTTIFIKAGPFSTIKDARDALIILSNWRFANVI